MTVDGLIAALQRLRTEHDDMPVWIETLGQFEPLRLVGVWGTAENNDLHAVMEGAAIVAAAEQAEAGYDPAALRRADETLEQRMARSVDEFHAGAEPPPPTGVKRERS